MKKIDVVLTPYQVDGQIASMCVRVLMEEPMIVCENLICSRNLRTVGIPFLDVLNGIKMSDSKGKLEVESSLVKEPQIEKELMFAKRDVCGDLLIRYEVILQAVGKNPVFDLGFEDGGMNGAGMTFLPYFPDEEYEITLDWNLTQLPAGYRGIWSYGEGRVSLCLGGNALVETFYYAGKVSSVIKGNSGFYWLPNPKFAGDEVGKFAVELFEKTAEFFEDSGKPYSIFSRKVPTELTGKNKMGGTALGRSFQYLYSQEEPPSTSELKFLFSHEMVHNWPRLEDDPFGTCTWYVEGTAEYYSLILPDWFGLITKEELVEQLNKRAKEYYENPKNGLTNQELGENLFVSEDFTRVIYGRGFFYLLHMDEVIREATKQGKSIDDVVLAILKRTNQGEVCQNEVWLEEVKNVAGIDVSDEFKLMQNGKLYPPTLSAFKTAVEARKIEGTVRGSEKSCILYQFS